MTRFFDIWCTHPRWIWASISLSWVVFPFRSIHLWSLLFTVTATFQNRQEKYHSSPTSTSFARASLILKFVVLSHHASRQFRTHANLDPSCNAVQEKSAGFSSLSTMYHGGKSASFFNFSLEDSNRIALAQQFFDFSLQLPVKYDRKAADTTTSTSRCK